MQKKGCFGEVIFFLLQDLSVQAAYPATAGL
jgi:hypothetical protein